MHIEKIALTDTHAFSSLFLDYIQGLDKLKSFYHRFPLPGNFHAQILEKSSFPKAHRRILVDTLQRQYQNITPADRVRQNIAGLLSEKTFVVTTGHQLNIFTGPLYFIYKIVSVITTCIQLRALYPDYSFVPMYWMASEDHDFAEISNFRLYGKKYQWQTDQTGAVGRFDPKSMEQLLNEIPGDIRIFKEAYLQCPSLSAAVRYYLNELFGSEGLVVVDADETELKNQFRKVTEDDFVSHTSKRLVDDQNSKLEQLGYHPQVHARDINFFYLDAGVRSRFEEAASGFKVVDHEIRFSLHEIQDLIRVEPRKFSPNVILRPLYQEMILPNLAYIGGPAEVAYWLQLKSVFDHFGVPFPILMPRNFAMVLDSPMIRKFKKTGLEIKDLFEAKNYIFNHWVVKNTHHDITLSDSIQTVREIFDSIRAKTDQIDQTLGPLVGAEEKRTLDRMEKIEKKMLRAEKRLHSEKLHQIEFVKDALFPEGSWQERTDNFLNFYQQNDHFVQELIRTFDPFDFRFNVLKYDD